MEYNENEISIIQAGEWSEVHLNRIEGDDNEIEILRISGTLKALTKIRNNKSIFINE